MTVPMNRRRLISKTAEKETGTRRGLVLMVLLVLLAIAPRAFAATEVVVGSKAFTESVILSEIMTQLVGDAGEKVRHERQLGGTQILWQAMLRGQIDAYPEYTGTISEEILAGKSAADIEAMRKALAELGIGMTKPLGFNNTYALGMRDDAARKLGIRTISNLREHPNLKFGLSNEFLNRKDGWPAVRQRYSLPQADVSGLDHDLAYRALADGSIDLTDLYSTDAEIAFHKLRVLEDDAGLFPRYDAVILYRLDLADRAPRVIDAIKKLEGRIDERQMIALNKQAKLDRVNESQVASDFIKTTFHVDTDGSSNSMPAELWLRTREHLKLVVVSLFAAIIVAVPLGIVAARDRTAGQIILSIVAAIYTIPGLALLVFMIPLLGIGYWPAVMALFLYSLLPIVRNTHAGLLGIPLQIRESAEVLGLSSGVRLLRIELPLASPAIMAGIKTSAVLNVGTATLGALIGAGGYGSPILTGIRLYDIHMILLGAVPAALMALFAQAMFEWLERAIVPRGLRLMPEKR